MPEEWLTAAEAAEALGISRSALYQRVAYGWLPAERDGWRLRIRREDLTRPSPKVRVPAPSGAKRAKPQRPQPPPPEGWANTEMARQQLGDITLATLYRMLRRGDLQGKKVGGRIMFDQRDLDDYIERRRIRPRAVCPRGPG